MGLDILSQYEIPYLHPLAVHFPLVLLLVGSAAALFYLILGKAPWRVAALILIALGTLTAWWASETGHELERAMEGEPIVDRVVHAHEDAAEWTLWTGGLTTFLLVMTTGWIAVRRSRAESGEGQVFIAKREPLLLRLLVAIPASAAAVLVAYTAHLGGIMVWGVPIRP